MLKLENFLTGKGRDEKCDDDMRHRDIQPLEVCGFSAD